MVPMFFELPAVFGYPVIAMATTLTCATLIVYMIFPSVLIQAYMRLSVLSCGMKIKSVRIGKHLIWYGEKGQSKNRKSSILLVHGFSADMYMWVPLVRKLTDDSHVIAIELPGHGNTAAPEEGEDISFSAYVEIINKFVSELGLYKSPFHMIGISMGGTISGVYSARYPGHVERLTMMCPAMMTPQVSKYAELVAERHGHHGDHMDLLETRLLPRTPEDVQEMLNFVQYRKTLLPAKLLKGIAEMRTPYYPYLLRMFKTMTAADHLSALEDTAEYIPVPTQLIWGEADQLIHISGIDVLKSKLPNCQRVDLIPRCGHNVTMDRPGAMTKAIRCFRGELGNDKKQS
ncbi:hypothetical protein ScPMuIL_009440 [Solemya velum]